MRRRLISSALGVCAGLAFLAASRPLPAHAARDICVKILDPVKSMVGASPGAIAAGRRATSEVVVVDVAIGDCELPPPQSPQGGASAWPPLSFGAGFDVSSAGRAICDAKAQLSVGGPPAPLPKVFRFQLVYPSRGRGTGPSISTQPLPILYTIRAAAQVTDSTQANNQGTTTFRFLPGGTASCLTLGKWPTTR